MKKNYNPKVEFEYMSEEMISSQQTLEEIVLGEILIEKESMYRVGGEFSELLFHDKKTQKIAYALKELFNANEPIDLLTLTKKLMANDTLKDIGGVAYVSLLTSKITTTINLENHFRMLQENYLRRFVVETNNHTNTKALTYQEDIFSTIDQQINQYSDALRGLMTNKIDLVGKIHSELLSQHILYSDSDSFSGVPTNLQLVDKVTNGWQKSDLIILAGRPAMGKTSCAIVFALRPAIEQNIPVAIFSLEMSKEQLVSRMQSILSTLNVSKLVKKQLNGSEIIELGNSTKSLETAPIYIDDTAGLSIIELKTKCRQLVRENGVQIIIIDYLQLMRSGQRNQPREQEIGEISRGLKIIAKELSVPVIALSQLSRSVESRGGDKKPQLSDLRESGQIEQDADMVMFCYRPEYYDIPEYEINDQNYPSDGLFLLLIAKHRNGSLGDIPLRFIHENTNIVDNPNFLPPPKRVETAIKPDYDSFNSISNSALNLQASTDFDDDLSEFNNIF
jgi:replicative DNA helicase